MFAILDNTESWNGIAGYDVSHKINMREVRSRSVVPRSLVTAFFRHCFHCSMASWNEILEAVRCRTHILSRN